MVVGIETALQMNEVIVALIAFSGLMIVIFAAKARSGKWFLGYIALFTGTVLSILEVYLFPEFLNGLEHLIGILAPSVLFFLWSHNNRKRIKDIRENVSKWRLKR